MESSLKFEITEQYISMRQKSIEAHIKGLGKAGDHMQMRKDQFFNRASRVRNDDSGDNSSDPDECKSIFQEY